MKVSLLMALLLIAMTAIIPIYSYRGRLAPTQYPAKSEKSSSQISFSPQSNSAVDYETNQNSSRPMSSLSIEDLTDIEYLSIYNLATEKVDKVSMQDYIRGAVAAEMPPTFHSEAMKAQAVSAHTYALYQHYFQQKYPNPALKGADFSADPSNIKGYASEVSMRRRYGDMADEYWNKITDAADSVLGYVMVYDGEPIIAAYHSACAGMTESAANVWSGEVPYLQAVDSPGDMLSPNITTTVKMTAAEVREKLEDFFPEISLPHNHIGWINVTEVSPSGYAVLADVGDISVHGKDLRTALGLKSTYMDISIDDVGFTFVTTGYGHGVGLSQYGADYMARQGTTFDEILTHYYEGAELALF